MSIENNQKSILKTVQNIEEGYVKDHSTLM